MPKDEEPKTLADSRACASGWDFYESAAWYHQEASGESEHRVYSLSPAGPRGHTNDVTHLDVVSSRRSSGVRDHHHRQEAAGTGGTREDDGMGLSHRREGAWIRAKTGQWSHIGKHTD